MRLAGMITAAVSSTNNRSQASNLYRNDLSTLLLFDQELTKIVIILDMCVSEAEKVIDIFSGFKD